jgi:hypothetical protein
LNLSSGRRITTRQKKYARCVLLKILYHITKYLHDTK